MYGPFFVSFILNFMLYSIAHIIHVSGRLAMVVAGLLVGNYGEEEAMAGITAD